MSENIEIKLTCNSAEMVIQLMTAYRELQEGSFKIPAADGEQGNGGETATTSQGAPTATPSTGNTTATADRDTDDTNGDAPMLDKRGVPFHGDFHYPRHKEDGSWVLRRNHDKTAREAYEAPFLGNPNGNQVASVASSTTIQPANAGVSTEPTPPAVSAFTAPAEPAAPSATFEAPTVRYLPGVAEYEAKWAQLCRELKVTGEHQAFIERTFGGHPCNPVVRDVEENRRQIWVVFLQWEQGVKGF